MGYKPNFLDGITLPMPSFSPLLEETVLKQSALHESIYAHYANYTVITSKERRSPILSALNIDQNKLQTTRRNDYWQIDPRIGAKYQLNNDYYRDNPWDRGHLARRASAAWGNSLREAQYASDETFYFSNASLQHKNFNQDEWLAIEDWVMRLALDKDGRISTFSGPVYGDYSRIISPRNRTIAEIPSAFFKIICFINKMTNNLDVRAFLMFQDIEALADKNGRNKITNFQIYQSTVSEIEEVTGLEFDNAIYENNPLLYHENPVAKKDLNISSFPERIEVDSPVDIKDKGTPRVFVADQEIDVFIIASLINPIGQDRHNEWVSILNLSSEDIDLAGWTLWDNKRKKLKLESVLDKKALILSPGQSIVVKPITPLQLSNSGGTITLFNEKNQRVDRVKHTLKDGKNQGKPAVFVSRKEKPGETANSTSYGTETYDEPIV